MPRNIEFNEQKVMETAMNLFWQKGYNAVSTKDMLDAFGISRSSMYNLYKDKRNLFILTLKHYRNTQTNELLRTLDDSKSFKPTIKKILDGLIDECLADKESKGCFMVNTAIELAPHDEAILNVVHQNREKIISSLSNAIQRSILKKELSSGQNPEDLAHYFYNVIFGFRVNAKLQTDRKIYENIAEIALSVLN